MPVESSSGDGSSADGGGAGTDPGKNDTDGITDPYTGYGKIRFGPGAGYPPVHW